MLQLTGPFEICTEHGSIIAVLCAKFQTDWIIETDVMDQWDFTRFEFKTSFGQISYIAQYPRLLKQGLNWEEVLLIGS